MSDPYGADADARAGFEDAMERAARDDRKAEARARRSTTMQLAVPTGAKLAWDMYARGLGVRPRDVALALLQLVAEDREMRQRMADVIDGGTYVTRWTGEGEDRG